MKMKNCPNCGAPVEGFVCEYCKVPLYTPTEAAVSMAGKRCHVFYEEDGNTICFDLMVSSVTPMSANLFTDNMVYTTILNPELILTAKVEDFEKEDWKTIFDAMKDNL